MKKLKLPSFYTAVLLVLALLAPAAYTMSAKPKVQPAPVKETLAIVRSVPVEAAMESKLAKDALTVWTDAFAAAKETIDMSFFYYIMEKNHPGENLEALLISKAEEGVKIRMIADKSFYEKMPEMVDRLKSGKKNIEVRIIDYQALSKGVMHAKYFIVDGKTVFMGSQNFDWRALSQIHEIGVLINSEYMANHYLSVFNADWEMALTHKKTLKNNLKPFVPHTLIYNDNYVTADLAASPKDLVPENLKWDFEKLLDILKQAKKTVNMQVLSYSLKKYNEKGDWKELEEALLETAKRGVKLNLIFSSWLKKEQIASLLSNPNITIKISTIPEAKQGPIEFARVEHCKYLIADGEVTWISTSNWSYDYFYNSRNLALIVHSTPFAADMQKIFEISWNGKHSKIYAGAKEAVKVQTAKK